MLTAHPTEATRRTILQAHQRARDARCAGSTTRSCRHSTRRRVQEQIAEEVTILWQTDEVRSRRPRVVDEIRNGLWFVEASLWQALPRLLARAARSDPGRAAAAAASARWIGGDMDGNPNAGAETIVDALERAADARTRSAAARTCARSARAWGMSTELVRRRSRSCDRRATSRTAPRSSGSGSGSPPTSYGDAEELADDLARDRRRASRARRGAASPTAPSPTCRPRRGVRPAPGDARPARAREGGAGASEPAPSLRSSRPPGRSDATGRGRSTALIVSMTASADDVLAAELLAREAGLNVHARAAARDDRRPARRARARR